MKMTKKLFFAAIAVAAVIGFASCQKEIGEIDWKGGVVGSGDGNTTFTVKQTNEADGTIRGMKQIGILNRAQGTCVLRQFDQTKTSCDGMVGFACCFTKNKDATKANNGTYNFLVVGVRNNKGTTETYASFFYNIAEDKLSTENFGVGKNQKQSYSAALTEPYEVEIEHFPKTLSGITFDKDGTLTVAVKLVEANDGSVTITWLKDVEENHQAATITGGTVLYTVEAKATKTGRDSTSAKGKICAYANIYSGKSLNAKWDIYDVSWSQETVFSADDDFIEVGDILFE